MSQDYLSIAQDIMDRLAMRVQTNTHISRVFEVGDNDPANSAAITSATICVKSVLSVKSPSILSIQVAAYLAECREIHKTLGIVEDKPGDYDHKATISGAIPPIEAVEAYKAWLSMVNWRYGVRCGIHAHQCRTCDGGPCSGSTL